MELDLDDDRLLLVGPPHPPVEPTLIAYVVCTHEDKEVVGRLPIYHRPGEPESWSVEWPVITRPCNIDNIRVLVHGQAVFNNAQPLRRLLEGDSFKLNLNIGGLRDLFDRGKL